MSANRFFPLASPMREDNAHDDAPVEAGSSTAPTSRHGASSTTAPAPAPATGKRRKTHRAGKKKRSRRKSFALLPDIADSGSSQAHRSGGGSGDDDTGRDRSADNRPHGLGSGSAMYRLGTNMSNASFGSSSLFDDHRSHHPVRPRRQSTHISHISLGQSLSHSHSQHLHPHDHRQARQDDGYETDEESPLLQRRGSVEAGGRVGTGYGSRVSRGSPRPPSHASSRNRAQPYDVNFPASHPGSPMLGAADPMTMSFGDVMIHDVDIDMSREGSPHPSIDDETGRTTLLDPTDPRGDGIGGESVNGDTSRERPGPAAGSYEYASHRRRRKWPDLATLEEWSRYESKEGGKRVKRITEPQLINGRLRPLRKGWYVAEEESPYRFTYFNEDFGGTIHSQTITELLHEGGSFRELFRPDPRILSDGESDDDGEEDSDCDVATAAGLRKAEGVDGESKAQSRQPSVAGGIGVLFQGETQTTVNEPPSKTPSPPPPHVSGEASVLSHPSSLPTVKHLSSSLASPRTPFLDPQRVASPRPSTNEPSQLDLDGAPAAAAAAAQSPPPPKPVRYGDRPVWWLDVLCPTESEMKVISKAFDIHPLTAEDIMLQEAREKVELFRNYYFVNYRTFDQDASSDNYLEPINMYVVVFREGVISFHFGMTPHAANVRRRIRQLKDYMILSSDWISYAIIDDITDVFGPLIQTIEDEVDEIDEAILRLHEEEEEEDDDPEKKEARKREAAQASIMYPGGPRRGRPASTAASSAPSAGTLAAAGGDMLRKVGNCRKRVMSLFRLLGNKADVIKGFAKRCNERWEVAPRSEIGLYLGDIQDHIVTMTSNLGHYEKILARSHANYLAQISIRMTARQEQTADVLGKLTVLGTIVLPMNIITGLWGMNVWVPGQEYEGDLTWFWCITAGLLAFGGACYIVAKRVYGIV